MEWSEHQLKIFDWVVERRGNAVVRACAGSGKTTTIVEALNRVPKRLAIVLAYNTEIKKELAKRITNPNHAALTMHSIGYRALQKFMKVGPPDGRKLGMLAQRLVKEHEQAGKPKLRSSTYRSAMKLVSKAKESGIGVLIPDDAKTWDELAQELDLPPHEETMDFARQLLEKSVEAARNAKLIDFDDQIYHCLLDDVPLPSYELVFVDEAQDLNPSQHEILKRVCAVAGQVVVVGDPDQAIYAFRGAAPDSFCRLAEMFNCTELPLTVSYRCPRSVVEFVNQKGLSAYLEVFAQALPGKVVAAAQPDWFQMTPDEDVILCRTNAPLLRLALRLLASGRPVKMLGKGNLLADLTRFIERFPDALTCETLRVQMEAYVDAEVLRLSKNFEDSRAEALRDKFACIETLIGVLPVNSAPADLVDKLGELLSSRKRKTCLVLSTVHQAKGREWERVWILRPESIARSWIKDKLARVQAAHRPDQGQIEKLEIEIEQSRHVEYVAYTRAKGGLYLMDWNERREIPALEKLEPKKSWRYYAKLDAERNRLDRARKRGYDFDGIPRSEIKVSEHVSLLCASDFGPCEVCGEPAALVVPYKSMVNGRRRFCGIRCYRGAHGDLATPTGHLDHPRTNRFVGPARS